VRYPTQHRVLPPNVDKAGFVIHKRVKLKMKHPKISMVLLKFVFLAKNKGKHFEIEDCCV